MCRILARTSNALGMHVLDEGCVVYNFMLYSTVLTIHAQDYTLVIHTI